MWIKICGTTNRGDAELSLAHGADALGFIFAPSKRRVTAKQAKAIIADLPPGTECVGVFTEASVAAMVATVEEAGLNAVQLHRAHDGNLTRALGAALAGRTGPDGLPVRLIQVIGVPMPLDAGAATQFSAHLQQALADPQLWAVLLDVQTGGRSGGLGVAFNWQAVAPLLQGATRPSPDALRRAESHPHLLLAGGLQAENVADAIAILRPWGVDCVSGVEAGPGEKDPDRLRRFCEAVRGTGAQDRTTAALC